MSVESDLRAELVERDGLRCRWGDCTYPTTSFNPLEMAHIEGKGMGGRDSANTIDNCVLMCRLHHQLFDGVNATHVGHGRYQMSANRKTETGRLLRAYLEVTR